MRALSSLASFLLSNRSIIYYYYYSSLRLRAWLTPYITTGYEPRAALTATYRSTYELLESRREITNHMAKFPRRPKACMNLAPVARVARLSLYDGSTIITVNPKSPNLHVNDKKKENNMHDKKKRKHHARVCKNV